MAGNLWQGLAASGNLARASLSVAVESMVLLLAQRTVMEGPEVLWSVPMYVSGRKWSVAPESSAA